MATASEGSQQDPIRIVSHVDSPLVNDCFDVYPNDDCLFPGYEVEYIYTVIHGMLRYPIQWIKVKSFDEVQSALKNDKADIMGQSAFLDPTNIQKFGYPPPAYVYDSLSLLVKESYTSQSQVLVLLRSFTWDLWSYIMGASLVCLMIRHLSKGLYRKIINLRRNFVKTVEQIFHVFRANVVFSVWFILVSLLLNFYSNLIAVDLVAPDRVKTVPFKTLNELGQKLLTKECQFVMLEKYVNFTEMQDFLINPMKSRRPWAPSFLEAFKTNPPSVAKDRDHMVEMISNGTCLVGVDWATMGLYYHSRYCDLRILSYPEEIEMLGYTFFTTREDLKEAMSTVILSQPLQAYTVYLSDKYYSKGIPVDCTGDKVITINPVNIIKMQDCFYILLTGLSIALLIMFYQRCRAWYMRLHSRVN